MQNKPEFIHFVRDTLGCTCPDEIFEQIEYTEDTPFKQITLGNRLLIYVWKTNQQGALEMELPALVTKGKAERDQRELNRFRLVIVSTIPEHLAPIAEQIFMRLSTDEKTHLHVVSQANIRFSI